MDDAATQMRRLLAHLSVDFRETTAEHQCACSDSRESIEPLISPPIAPVSRAGGVTFNKSTAYGFSFIMTIKYQTMSGDLALNSRADTDILRCARLARTLSPVARRTI